MSSAVEEETEGEREEEILSYSAIMQQKISSMMEKAYQACEDGDHARCISTLSRAIALEPRNAELFKRRADACVAFGDYHSAILNYKRTIILNPAEEAGLVPRMADAFFQSGKQLRAEEDFVGALEAFSKASECRPGEREYTLQRIGCLLSLQHYTECQEMVRAELEQGPPTSELFVLHARINLVFEKNTEAYYDLCRALELDPAHREAIQLKTRQASEAKKLRSQAVKYLLLGQREGAMKKISAAIECDPDEAEFHVLRGAFHRQARNYSRAVDELLTAVDKCEGQREGNAVHAASCRQLMLTYNDFAVLCFKRQRYNEAIQLLDKALQDEKKEAGLYVNRGDCFYHLGNLHFALADYVQALQLSPEDWQVRCRGAVVQCELGVQEFSSGHFDKADELFSAAIENNPKVSRFYLCRARTKHELKQDDEAREDLLRVLVLEPECDGCLPLIARVFPGKNQSDLLSSPELAAVSTELRSRVRQSLGKSGRESELSSDESERMRRKEGTQRERELQELFSQLRLKTSSSSEEEGDPARCGDSATGGGDTTNHRVLGSGGRNRCPVAPVLHGNDLPSAMKQVTASSTRLDSTGKTSEKLAAKHKTVSRDGKSRKSHDKTSTNSLALSTASHSCNVSTPPRNWPVLSLPLPPMSPSERSRGRGKYGRVSVVPDVAACEREKRFHTMLYYSKKDCTAEVQQAIHSSPPLTSPPHETTPTRTPS